jgi:hypothetical protein
MLPGLYSIDTVCNSQRYFRRSSRSINLNDAVAAVPPFNEPASLAVINEPPLNIGGLSSCS